MKYKSRYYKYIIIVIILIVFTYAGNIRWIFWKEPHILWEYKDYNYSTKDTTQYQNISWIVLDGPSNKNRDLRANRLWKNQNFIYWWIYDITYQQSKKRLYNQNQTKDISLIVEDQKYQQYSNDFKKLQKDFSDTNIVLTPDKNLKVTYTHAKTFVGDKTRIIQTANLNRTSFVENREHFFLWTDETIRKNLIALFELDQQVIKDKKPYIWKYQTLLESFSPNLLVCPLNCRQIIESLLSRAKQSIYISTQYITDNNIINILRKQSDKKIIIRTNDFDANKELIRFFWKENMIFENSKIYNHDKMIIIDNKILMIWSMNLSENALDNNREIGIVTTDKKLIEQQEKLFQYITRQ